MSDQPDQDGDEKLNFWQMLSSTLSAALGVQSHDHRQRDFEKGNAWKFIAMGLGFTVTLVVTIIVIVQAILATTG